MKTDLFLLLIILSAQARIAQSSDVDWNTVRPGIAEVQVPFATLKPEATFKIGENADWVEITDDAVWVASSNPASVHRIDPRSNKEIAVVPMPGDPCAGQVFAFGSLWTPLCGKPNSIARIDAATNRIIAILPIGPAGDEGGITASRDSVWIVTDKAGSLVRIDPATNKVRQKIPITPGSYNPWFSENTVWITGTTSNLLTAVDAQSKKVTTTIRVGIPGPGGDIAWGAGSVWATVFGVPLTVIDGRTNEVVRQWVGLGGDSLRFGHDSVWLTDYKRGTLSRIPYRETLKSKISP